MARKAKKVKKVVEEKIEEKPIEKKEERKRVFITRYERLHPDRRQPRYE